MRAASELDQHAVAPRLFLARIYVTTGELSEAEGVYKELKRIAPDDPRAYGALGAFYASNGQKGQAVAELQSALASKPKDRSIKASLIETLLDLKRDKEAKALNRELLTEAPADPQGLLSGGRILIAEGKFQDAAVSLEKAVKSDPKSAESYYFLGVAQKALGLPDQAKSSFAQALQLAPQMTAAAVASSAIATTSGDYDQALSLSSEALKLNPNLPSAYVASAQASLGKGDAREGEAQIQEALKRDPVSLPALAMRLKLDISQGRAQESVQRISTLVQQYPQKAGLHFLLGLSYFGLKDFEKSEVNVRQAIAIDPRTPDAYTLLANLDFAKGAANQGKMDLRTAIDANPRNVSNYVALGTQYEKEGNWEEAKKLYEKAHEVDSGSPYIADELAFIYMEHGGDVNVALSLAQQAKQRLPGSPVTADALGWAYYRLGANDSAIGLLKECAQKVPNNPVFQYHLGMAYMAAGNRNSAERSLRQALKDDPHFPYASSARVILGRITKAPAL
jgi:tetratricopeptide (TPR) repeat protein